jgi:ornithine carbamoyltransferase
MQAALKFDFNLIVSSPFEMGENQKLAYNSLDNINNINIETDPYKAAKNADLIVTDTHISMHTDRSLFHDQKSLLAQYKVTKELMENANKEAIFMHCLPAHRNEEVSSDVIDGSQSVIFDEAENRLHVQKSIMKWCVSAI